MKDPAGLAKGAGINCRLGNPQYKDTPGGCQREERKGDSGLPKLRRDTTGIIETGDAAGMPFETWRD